MPIILNNYVRKTKIFTSNRAESLEKKANLFLETIPYEIIIRTHHSISYTDKRGYMISYVIDYLEPKETEDETLDLDFNIDFGISNATDIVPL